MQKLEVRSESSIAELCTCLISSHFYVCKFDREHEEKEEKLIEFSFGILNSSMWWKAMTCWMSMKMRNIEDTQQSSEIIFKFHQSKNQNPFSSTYDNSNYCNNPFGDR